MPHRTGDELDQDTLRTRLDARAPRLLPAEDALAILEAVSESLFPLHASGRAYGAFGPRSILDHAVDPGDGDRVVDLAEDPIPEEGYAAPELADGAAPTTASDSYSYAVLAHVLLTGELPAFAEDGTPMPVAQQHPGFPAFAGEAIARALQADPTGRPLPKVLHTLLNVVPLDRWPAAAQPDGQADTPAEIEPAAPAVSEPAAVTGAEPEPEPEPAPEPAEGAAVESDVDADEDEDPWRTLLATGHDVPSIRWSPTGDPTRPDEDVPEIAPAAEQEPESTDVAGIDAAFLRDFESSMQTDHEVPAIEPLAESLPEVEHRAGRRRRRRGRGAKHTHTVLPPLAEDDPGELAEPVSLQAPADAELPDEPVVAEDVAGTDEATDTPWPGDDHQDDEQDDEQRPEQDTEQDEGQHDEHDATRRPRTRTRTRTRWTNEQLQKAVLVLLVIVLLLAAVMWALTHKSASTYDPQLQGASRSLAQVAPVRS